MIGKHARNLYQEVPTHQEELEEYAALHSDLIKQLNGFTGLNRTVAITMFNESYAFGRDIRHDAGSALMYRTVDVKGPLPEYAYLKRVMDLCLRTDIAQKLGMSMVDFMHLDYATFNYIEKEYYDHKPIEQDAVEEMMREMDLKSMQKKGR